MIGLTRGTVTVAPHDITWKDDATQCIAILKQILNDDAVDIQHVGSTSICGICAKPIIDIAVGVDNFDIMLSYNGELSEQGIYYRKQEHGKQLLYVCGDLQKDIITHHIHVVLWNSEDWKNYINFRDYLNCHEEEARKYSELKKQLACKYADNRSMYTTGKQKLIDEILQKASKWQEKA